MKKKYPLLEDITVFCVREKNPEEVKSIVAKK
jgi:hypothetical protein